MKITITVPLVPPSPNVMRRKYKHFMAYKRLRDNWETTLFYCTPVQEHARFKEWLGNYKMRLHVTIHHLGQARDPDNLQASPKVLIDALKNIGFLKDDTGEWLELLPVVEVEATTKRDRKTVIELEPIWEWEPAA